MAQRKIDAPKDGLFSLNLGVKYNSFWKLMIAIVQISVLAYALYCSYDIRLNAVRVYGKVIHEFDPWFNYRATDYLVNNGWERFRNWFDTESWYPLGRHVGSTIYPGLQVTAWGLYELNKKIGWGMDLNDICVYMPAVFGILTTFLTFMLSWEISGSVNAGVASAYIMAILPAHLMRSVAGGFDNESIAVAAIVGTFYLWIRSLRTPSSWPLGILTGLSYIYMVAAWGGYVFVLNMIGIHAILLVALGCFNHNLHRAYSLFFLIGTYGALQFPFVGNLPFDSMEQIGPLGVFFIMQIFEFLELKKDGMAKDNDHEEKFNKLRRNVFSFLVLVGAVVFGFIITSDRIAPLSNRVRSLFIPHTKTGNPLVDSVAEHQATPADTYFQYFHFIMYVAPLGWLALMSNRPSTLAAVSEKKKWFSIYFAGRYFALEYTLIAAYFSRKMIRLVLMLAPASAICAGVFIGYILELLASSVIFAPESATAAATAAAAADANASPSASSSSSSSSSSETSSASSSTTPTTTGTPNDSSKKSKKNEVATHKGSKESEKKKVAAAAAAAAARVPRGGLQEQLISFKNEVVENSQLRAVFSIVCFVLIFANMPAFVGHCYMMAEHLSHPQLMVMARTREGQPVILDDFRESYWWLRDNTPEDARVMSWWDYGYQINGIANRTTIADGNTWNHEHIALLGKCLVSPEEASWKMVRHLADFVLVWTTRHIGMMGDDLAKMPWMARIGGSVYKDIKPDLFWVDQKGNPSPATRESLLWKLHNYQLTDERITLKYFEEAYTSKNRMVRIFRVLKVAPRHPHGSYAPELPVHEGRAFNQRAINPIGA